MKRTFLLFFILLFPVLFLSAQTDSVAVKKMSKYIGNIQTFNRLLPQEKVYLHFDNTGYIIGETIWFKAYVVTASQHRPTGLSGVLYVELLNAKGKVLETKKLKIVDGACNGDFPIDPLNVEYFPGFYEVRAYTKAMLNFGEEIVFSRVFPVFDSFHADGNYSDDDLKENLQDFDLPALRKKSESQSKINFDLYPEGGNLVSGIKSKIAFRASDENGRAIEVNGKVIDSNGEVQTSFASEHKGMGTFEYIPGIIDGKIKVKYENREYDFDFPESFEQGYIMTVNNFSKNSLTVQVEKSPGISVSTLGLSILCRGEISFFQTIVMDSFVSVLKIPKEILSSGVNQITLFDGKGEIFAERSVFIYPREEEQVVVNVSSDKEYYSPLDTVDITISVSGNRSLSGFALSVAVRDGENMPGTVGDENMATSLLLSSDLRGYVENPEYYFQSIDSKRMVALDQLMMIQGWKRYEWQEMAGIKPFDPKYDVEKSLIIKGKLAPPDGRNAEVRLKMQSENNDEFMEGTSRADKEGVFYFQPEDFYGRWDLSLTCREIEDAYKNIRLDRWFSPKLKAYTFSETSWKLKEALIDKTKLASDISSFSSIELENDSIKRMYMIPEVDIKSNRKQKKNLIYNVWEDIDKLTDREEKIPYSVHDYLLLRDIHYKFNGCGAIDPFQIIGINEEKIIIAGSFYRDYNAIFYSLYNDKWEINPSVRLKTGTHYSDIRNKHLTIKRNVLEVEKILIQGEFITFPFYSDPFTAIYIYSLKNYAMREIPGVRYTMIDGFSKPKDFFDAKQYKNGIPDSYEHRRTLYWNPNVEPDEEGRAHIRFYNNLYCRIMDINVQGLDLLFAF